MTSYNLSADTYVDHADATKNFASSGVLKLRADTTSVGKKAYLAFARPFPLGVTITSAYLTIYRAGAWTGTKTVKVNRVTTAWKASTLDWSPQPTVDTANQGSLAANAGADNSKMQVDITALMQDISDGSTCTGLQITLTQDAEVSIRSKDCLDKTLAPVLEIAWTTGPVIPSSSLLPSGGQAVATSTPRLTWGYQDSADQTSYHVQVSTDGITADVYNSGVINSSDHFLDSSGHFTVGAGVTRYWRVQVWDSTGAGSGWSAWQTFTRTDLSSLTLSAPGATTDDLTPTVSWTFGGTQSRYKVVVEKLNASTGAYDPWCELSGNTTTASARVPDDKALNSADTFKFTVSVWDNVARAYDEYATVSQVTTYVRSGVPAATTTLTATAVSGTPAVLLHWTATTPDYFCLKVDGLEVMPRIVPGDVSISSYYELEYWGASPGVSHTYEIERVVDSAGVLQNSDANPTASATASPIGVFLVDQTTNLKDPTWVRILGHGDASLDLGETAATYYPVGSQSPRRIQSTLRGYEGSFSGLLDTQADRDAFLDLKGRLKELRLIMGDINIPIIMEGASSAPTPYADLIWTCSFSFFQCGEPWPV